MTKHQAVETLDRSLHDIMDCSLPFGGKVVVFGGDFRQVLPVVTRGTRAQITDATLLRSYLWEKTRKIRLTRNMRAQADPWFSEYLLRIGNGLKRQLATIMSVSPRTLSLAIPRMKKLLTCSSKMSSHLCRPMLDREST